MSKLKQRKKYFCLQDKKGAALLIAIVVMMVMMVLGMALLLISYSLFHTANKTQQNAQCEEMAMGVSQLIESEITGIKYQNLTEMETDVAKGDAADYPLWLYLRYNVLQTNWPYYNEEERGHTENYAYRYFDINTDDAVDTSLITDTSILMWWESEEGATSDPEDIPLKVQVTCKMGEQKATITTTYSLDASAWTTETSGSENDTQTTDSGEGGVESGIETGNIISSNINPAGNIIETTGDYANWTWSFEERE